MKLHFMTFNKNIEKRNIQEQPLNNLLKKRVVKLKKIVTSQE